MADRYEIAEIDELSEEGSRIIAEVTGQEIAVFRYKDDFHAVANYCIHQAGPLCEGPLTGRTTLDDDKWGWKYEEEEKYVMCPWHGWTFDITTGRSPKDDRYAVPTYDIEVEDGTVYVRR